MITVPAKVKERLTVGLKRFQPIVSKARDKDINESDTVTIIADILSEVFGYDKYTEVTSELAIKKTFCDLAIVLDGTVRMLIEVKAAGLDLKDQHIRQAVDYGSNSGVDWVILTNGATWKVYKVIFSRPITTDLVFELDFTQLSSRRDSDMEFLYYLTRESMQRGSKAAISDYHAQKQLLNRFIIGQILLEDSVLTAVRKCMKKISADTKVTNEEIGKIIFEEVLKREVIDGEKAVEAKRSVARAMKEADKATRPSNDPPA